MWRDVPASSTIKVAQIEVSARISPLYFIKLDLIAQSGELVSTNFYWQHVAQDQFDGLEKLSTVALDATAQAHNEGDKTLLTITLQNNTKQRCAAYAPATASEEERAARVAGLLFGQLHLAGAGRVVHADDRSRDQGPAGG